ncbi:MAG: GAF domain-containing protein [Fodinibius sp.]|nr:GAF domain-containing protein [Fodinibius sp.]
MQQVVEEIQLLTEYERVMYYRFEEDGTGVVTHEARRDSGIGSYLDHHFPAADIPTQARNLYCKNSLRFIFDVEGEAVTIQPTTNPRTGRSLDLSYAMFRSVARPRRTSAQYGVGASLSLSISDR